MLQGFAARKIKSYKPMQLLPSFVYAAHPVGALGHHAVTPRQATLKPQYRRDQNEKRGAERCLWSPSASSLELCDFPQPPPTQESLQGWPGLQTPFDYNNKTDLDQSAQATETKYHRLGGLKEEIYLLAIWRMDVWDWAIGITGSGERPIC